MTSGLFGYQVQLVGKSKECIGVIFIGYDITREMDIHGKLIEGSSYIIPDTQNFSSIDLFLNLSLSGRSGMIITRSNPAMIKTIIPKTDVTIVLLSQSPLKDFHTISTLEQMYELIAKYTEKTNKCIILIDGVHYFLTRYSFRKFITSLYTITETIAKNKSILFVRIDPSTIEDRQLSILQNELQTLPSNKINGLIIEDDVFQVLAYIYEQNRMNAMVSFKKLSSQFKIVYVTAAKRIDILEKKGLVTTKKEGKLRTIYITDKGKAMRQRRQSL